MPNPLFSRIASELQRRVSPELIELVRSGTLRYPPEVVAPIVELGTAAHKMLSPHGLADTASITFIVECWLGEYWEAN